MYKDTLPGKITHVNPYNPPKPFHGLSAAAHSDENTMIRNELEKAKAVLDKSKMFPMRNTGDVISNTQLFIDTETSFLNTIRNITSQGLPTGKLNV